MPRSLPRIRLSSFYFVYFSILGILIPYWPLYLQEAGHDAAQIGAIMALIPATKIVSPAFWGWLADRSGRTLRLIRWVGFLSWVGFSCLLWDRTGLKVLIGVMLGFSFCWNATLPLFESLTLSHLGKIAAGYSRIRLWGSVGFIASVWIVGQLLEGTLSLTGLPEIILGLLVVQWCISLVVPPAREMRHTGENASLVGILRRGEVLVFFFSRRYSCKYRMVPTMRSFPSTWSDCTTRIPPSANSGLWVSWPRSPFSCTCTRFGG